jgi:hypothetical protein
MRSLRRTIAVLAAAGLTGLSFGPGAALGYGDGTPDESPPAEEQVCDEAGLFGAAYGLCVAFCEANDCDEFPDSNACGKLRANYARATGELLFPCEDVPPPGDS